MHEVSRKIYFSIALLATGVIAFELVLMQIFSITQWYHFAYMIISVAMLGFGAAGTCLSLLESWLLDRYKTLFPSLLFLCGITMAVVVDLSNWSFVRFDTYLIFTDFQQVGRLILTYLLFFIPFFLAALAIGLTFIRYVRQIGALYFADLFGSGLGALLGLGLLWLFFPWDLPALIAVLPIIAGFLSFQKGAPKAIKGLALLSVALIGLSMIKPSRLQLSEFKSISKILLLPEAKVEIEKNSPYGLVQVVSSPALRYAPGLSLNYSDTVPVRKAIFNNGNWIGSVIPQSESDSAHILDFTTGALPYFLRQQDQVLVLNAGSGEQLAYALARGAEKISLEEANPVILSFLRNELAEETDSLLFHPRLTIHQLEARTLLYTDTNKYDLIVLPVVSAFGGTAGINALQEQYIMTLEAFQEMWHKLKPEGMISISSWLDYPPRNPLKILATLVETLEAEGINNGRAHLLGIKSWGNLTFLLKRSPFTKKEMERVRSFCHNMHFDPILMNGLQVGERQQYNQLQDTLFFAHMDALLSSERAEFYESYDFNIQPATDDRPYFSQFIRWRNFSTLSETFGFQGLPFLEIGYLIVVLTFFQILLVAMVLIILPLFRIRIYGGGKWRILFYFGGIGLGYMFVEIVLIQQFMFYFGNPIYATAALISSLLIASGGGSYYSSKIMKKGYKVWKAPAIIIVMLMLISGIIKPILLSTIGWMIWAKIFILLLLVMPLGFIMGIPFPSGITHIAQKGKGVLPWAWGVNGYCSVISSALATILAVELGFWWVMVGAALGYLFAFFSYWRMND